MKQHFTRLSDCPTIRKSLLEMVLLVATTVTPLLAQAQTLGDYTYSTNIDTTKWIDMAGATQILTPTNNRQRASAVQNMGFEFPFAAGSYTQYSVNTDGNLRLGPTVTGTGSYATPFSSTNANVNNPKINFFACDGYGATGTHYVRALNTVDSNSDSLLCVEFCMGTYNTSTRSNLYKWQVHLYHNGDVEVVYGPSPAAAPAVSRQPGLCVNSSDGWYVNGSHEATHFTSGTNYGIASGNWPEWGRYYRFDAPAEACPKPTNLTVSDIDSVSFDLSWTNPSDATSWIVWLTANGTAALDTVATSTTIHLSGLAPATYYQIQVAGLCQNGDTSNFSNTTAMTQCAMITSLPYLQTFEYVEGTSATSVATNNLPPCWWYHNTGTSSLYSGYPIVYASSTHAYSGTKSMRFYTYYTAGTYGNQTAILPITDSTVLPLTGLQLSFWMRAHTESYNSHVVVGVMSNPYDANSFIPVETVYTNNSTIYSHHSVYLAGYRGPHGNIAIKAPQPTTGYNYLYIDDVAIEAMPPCPSVTQIATANAGPTSINVAWRGVGMASSWSLLYMPTGYPLDSAWSAVAYDTTITLTDLTPNTPYTLMIVANCGSDISDTAFATFHTTCDFLTTLPFTEDFESTAGSDSDTPSANNMPSCWRHYNIGTSINYSVYPIIYQNDTHAYSGSNAMRFHTYTTAGTYSDQIAVLPPTDSVALPLSILQLSFWMRSTSSSYNSYAVVGVMTNPADANTFVPIETVQTLGSTTYAEHTVLMGRYRGPHGYIAIKVPQPTTGYNSLLIDNVTIDYLPSCPPVGAVTVCRTTPDSIAISWYALGSETSWLVSDGTNEYVATDTLYTFGGLAPNTPYTLSVRALCPTEADTSEAVSVNATTACSHLTSLPFSENFDSHEGFTTTSSSVNNLPTCWAYINHGTRANYSGYPIIYNSSSDAYSGENCLRYYSYHSAADSDQYAVLPCTDSVLYPIGTLELRFQMRGGNTNSNYKAEAIVGVMADPADPRTFIPVDTVRSIGSTTYSNHAVRFNSYTGHHGHAALKFPTPQGSGYNYNTGYIDDLVLDAVPDCLPVVQVTVSNVTSNTAHISWLDTNANTSWFVEYGVSGFTPGLGIMATAYDTSITLTGLMANTTYDVYVTPNCWDGFAGSASVSFLTGCGPIDSLPYSEGFEGYPVGSSSIAPPDCGVPCYRRLDNASQYHFGYVGSPSSFPTGAHSGSGFLYYYMPTTTGSYADWIITVLPPINTSLHPINTLQLSFWTKMNSTSTTGNIIVGMMTDPLDDSTFVPVDTVHVSGNVYDLKTVLFNHYSGTADHIALKYTRNPDTNTYYFVDDILVEPIPACPAVTNITLLNSDTNMLTLTWTETGNATSWNVEYGISGFTQGSGTTTVANSTPFTVTGLTAATNYDVYITPVCPEGSTATRMAAFRTANSYNGLPYACTFESTAQNAAWSLANGGNTNKWVIGTAATGSGAHALYISNDNGTSNAYTTSSSTLDYAYIDVFIPTPGDYTYSYDWRCHGEGTYDFLRVALIPSSQTLTAGTTLPSGLSASGTPTSWIPLDGGSKLNLQDTWLTRSDIVSVPTAGFYHLAFIFRCDGSSGTNPPPAVDNITLSPSLCARPDSITISSLTQSTASFTWSETGSATVWQYQVDSGSIVTVYTTGTALSGLAANTQYTFRVRSICGGGDTSVWRTYSFNTPCNTITLPYTQDFESETTSSSSTGSPFVDCWIRLNNGTSSGGYPYVGGSSYNHTSGGSKGLYWYNSTTIGTYGDYLCAVLPPVDTSVNVNSLQLTFWGKSSSASASPVLQIGVMSNPNNLATFVGIDTVSISGTNWREIQVPLSAHTGNGKYVALKADRAGSSWGAYTDDFTLDYTPTCIAPQHVYATHATTSSITLDWVDLTPAMEWQVEYGPQGFVRGSSAGTSLTTTSHPLTIAGLDSLTIYDFYIRPVCTVGDTANWTATPTTTLNTAMCDHSIDFTIGSPSSSGLSYQAPVNNYYKYSLSEVIIESSEIGGPMDIEYIGYYYNHTTAMTDKVNCTIYFQPTYRSTFSSSSDVEALDTSMAVMVYSGPLNCSHGWNYFPLDSVYSFDGNTNLMVIVDDNSNDYNSNSYVFRTEPCTGSKTLYYYSDSQNPDPVTVSASYSGSKAVASWRPVMQLLSCSAPYCHQPVVSGATATYHSATITWDGDSNLYEVNIKETAAANWPAADITVTGNTHTFNGLNPSTHYTVRLRQDCTAAGLGHSEYTTHTFTTDNPPCFAPDSLTVAAVTNATATFDWAPIGAEPIWQIHVWYSGSIDSIYTVSAHPATVGGLTANTTYNAAIRALCDSANNIGDWGDTITFTTAACPDVAGLAYSDLSANSVTLSWTADPLAQQWIIEYGYSGFDQGTGTTITTTLNTYTINGLVDNMQYDFLVRAVCGSDWQSENWASITVTTPEGGVPCEAPTNVSAVVAGNSATISWTANTGNLSYTLEYGQRGFAHGSGITVTATSSPITLSNLDYDTDYDVYVQGVCDQSTLSAWSAVCSFTTEAQGSEECDPVTDLNASNITESSALISWTPGATGDEWEVVVTTAAGTTVSEASTTEHQYALSGLTPGTAYIAKVRTVCGDGVYSTFASVSFTTVRVGIDGVVEPACTIYPNPTSSTTTITVAGVSGKVKIAVIDLHGSELATTTLDCTGDCTKSFDVDRLAQGAYFVRVTGENVNMVKKLIVR